MRLYRFTHPDLYNAVFVVIAYNEQDARFMLSDYDSGCYNSFSPEDYELVESYSLSSGVKIYEHD